MDDFDRTAPRAALLGFLIGLVFIAGFATLLHNVVGLRTGFYGVFSIDPNDEDVVVKR